MFAERTGWNLTPNRFSQAVQRQRVSGARILDLTASNPTQVGLEYDQKQILSGLTNPAVLDYSPEPRGLRVAREAVCRYYREKRVEIAPDQIILTTSTSEAYSFVLLLLCSAGDEVL